MENASKALIIAGGVLVAMLVISLLVYFFGSLKELQSANQSVDISEQMAEFNKQYDVYYRDNIYGSEMLSLTNKVVDYNTKYREDDGYSKLDIEVTFTSNITAFENGKQVDIIKSEQKYDSATLKDKMDYADDKMKEYGDKKISAAGNKKISTLSSLRTNELKQVLGMDPLNVSEPIPSDIKSNIDNYLSFKAALNTFKSKTFNATQFSYNDTNARIKLMKFTEN